MKHDSERLIIGSPLTAYIFLIIAAVCLYMPFSPIFWEDRKHFENIDFSMVEYFAFISCIFILLAIGMGTHYIFSEKGIRHFFWGIPGRMTKWEDIIDAAVLYTGQKDNSKGILFTVKGGTVFRPSDDPGKEYENFFTGAYAGNKQLRRCHLSRKCFFVAYDVVGYSKNIRENTIPFVETHYGSIDYFTKAKPIGS